MEVKVNLEKIRNYKLLICTPMYGGQCTGIFTESCLALFRTLLHYGIEVHPYFIANESLIQRGRNYCADVFLRSGFTHMLFIDSDIGFKAQDVLVMLALYESDPEKYNILCAPYPKKVIAWEKIKAAVDKGFAKDDPNELGNFVGDFVFNPAKGATSFKLDEPAEVMESGTGFMMIPRETLVKWAEAYPEKSYLPDHARSKDFSGDREIVAYFDCVIDPESKRYLSEDYYFCQMARKAGMSVWLCPWMELVHVGSYTFGGSLAAIAAVGVSPTVSKPTPKTLPENLSGLKPKK